jgi:hypothetical protein
MALSERRDFLKLVGIARSLRIEFPSAVYNVMVWGNQGRSILKAARIGNNFSRPPGIRSIGRWLIHAHINGQPLPCGGRNPEANLVAGMK